MSIQVKEFVHVSGENDAEYIRLLNEQIERQKKLLNKSMAKLKKTELNIGEWIPVSDIQKLQDILLFKINSFEGTRNSVEKGMLEAWKDVAEYIDGMLGEDTDD